MIPSGLVPFAVARPLTASQTPGISPGTFKDKSFIFLTLIVTHSEYRHKDQDRDSVVDSSGSPAKLSSRTDRRSPEALLPDPGLLKRPWQQTSFHETSQLDENTAVPWNYPRDTSAVKLTQEVGSYLMFKMKQVDSERPDLTAIEP